MRNKSTLAFYTFLFSLCILLFSSSELVAQENDIYEVNATNTLSKTSSKKENPKDRESFYDLAFKLHTTSYVENNSIRKSNKNSTSVSKLTFNDVSSFNVLKQTNQDFNDVELITIVLKSANDLNNKIDLTEINGFDNLKYVYIKCQFNCSEQQIKGFVTSNGTVRVFYKTEIPS